MPVGCGGSQAGPGSLALRAAARACNPVETGLMEGIRSEPEPRRGVWRTGTRGSRGHASGPTGALVAGRAGSGGGWPLSSPIGAEARVRARSRSRRLVEPRGKERGLLPPGIQSSRHPVPCPPPHVPDALLGSPLCSGPSRPPQPWASWALASQAMLPPGGWGRGAGRARYAF